MVLVELDLLLVVVHSLVTLADSAELQMSGVVQLQPLLCPALGSDVLESPGPDAVHLLHPVELNLEAAPSQVIELPPPSAPPFGPV